MNTDSKRDKGAVAWLGRQAGRLRGKPGWIKAGALLAVLVLIAGAGMLLKIALSALVCW